MAVPPGSRVQIVGIPCCCNALQSNAAWVVLPLPSGPSNATNKLKAFPYCLA